MMCAAPYSATVGSTGPATTPGTGDGDVVLEHQPQKLAPPPLFRVWMLNDDYTPMEFVVEVLQGFFHHTLDAATRIMLTIHHEGRGICGVYPRDVAATKVELVLDAAQQAGHPLQCTMEAA